MSETKKVTERFLCPCKLEEHEEPLSDEIGSARLKDMSEVEILATHITSSSVHDLLILDDSFSQVSLAL